MQPMDTVRGGMTQPREKIRGKHPITDPHYRYEMEQLLIQPQKGRVALPNLSIVAKHLHRPQSHILKWMGHTLSCGIIQPEELQGVHSPVAVQDALYTYIQEFVLCPKCHLPETHLAVGPTGALCHKCHSCGAQMPTKQSRYTDWVLKEIKTRPFL
jgi:translation initiation factor 2 beta subunit (eIF-2beta)/eIF-5